MTLGMEVGLGPFHIVLDGDAAPLPKKGAEPPIFGQSLFWPNGRMHQYATWYRGRPQPGDCVRWGPSPSSQKRPETLSQFPVHFYCGQKAGCIKMPLDMEVGLRPEDFALDADPVRFPKRRRSPQFSAHVYCGQTAGWIKIALGKEVGLGPVHIVPDEDTAPSPKQGAEPPPPNFRPIFIVAKRLDASKCHLVWR